MNSVSNLSHKPRKIENMSGPLRFILEIIVKENVQLQH